MQPFIIEARAVLSIVCRHINETCVYCTGYFSFEIYAYLMKNSIIMKELLHDTIKSMYRF